MSRWEGTDKKYPSYACADDKDISVVQELHTELHLTFSDDEISTDLKPIQY